eukprot:SAG31_NODE_1918_length_6921_cov_2.015245_8_plen_140_part_00
MLQDDFPALKEELTRYNEMQTRLETPKRLFREYDKNGDGALDRDEFHGLLTKLTFEDASLGRLVKQDSAQRIFLIKNFAVGTGDPLWQISETLLKLELDRAPACLRDYLKNKRYSQVYELDIRSAYNDEPVKKLLKELV